MDVVQVILFSDGFFVVLSGFVFHSKDFLLTESSVAIDGDLAIGGDYSVISSQNQGVNFNHVAVTFDKALVKTFEHVCYLVSLFTKTNIMGGFV